MEELTPHPLRNRVLVRQDPAIEKVGSAGILYAPQGLETWPNVGTVVEIGPQDEPLDLRPGDRVIFKREPASALIWDRREQMFCPESWQDLLMMHTENIHLVVTREGEEGIFEEPKVQTELALC